MTYHLANTRHFDTRNDCFVIDLDLNCVKNQLAVNLCNKSIEIIDAKTLQTIQELKDLDSMNSLIKYSSREKNQLMVCTAEAVHLYDVRDKCHKSLKQFIANISQESGDRLFDISDIHLTCFDTNCDFTYLCAGTEVSEKDKNSYLLFWDIRRPALVLGAYYESHTNDVTDVAFHPQKRHLICSGGCDELINLFDLNETEEDEALISTLNVESVVDRIHWTKSDENDLICLTREESIQLWNIDDILLKSNFNSLSLNSGFDYIVGTLGNEGVVCVGDSGHCIKMFDINTSVTSDRILILKFLAMDTTKWFGL
ncbi:WD repeat-containing protein 89-like [Oppia nitens]|uniref:WD repeat-containing protein 89-like n=1 Tax=Oppia nitens TaxID=1686743 RepID=UPI0023DB4B3F|nr:WD repeat-containing protein 89-like [Oppia nitens]